MSPKKKGYTLALVLAVTTMMTLSVIALWSNTNTDQQIAENQYRISQARTAAQSGLSHFISLHLSDEDLTEGNVVIPETSLSAKTAYAVEIRRQDENYVVLSRGYYKKAGETVFEYPIRAVFSPAQENTNEEQ